MNRRTMLVGLAVSAFAMTGCARGEAQPATKPLPSHLEKIRPTDTPPPQAAPASAPPAGFTEVKGDHYTLHLPPDWAERPMPTQANSKGNAHLYHPRAADSSSPLRFGVVLDANPRSGAIEQSEVLKTQKELYGGKNVTRSEVVWPGAQRAVVVDWTEELGEKKIAVRQRQLFAEVSDTLIVNAVAVAPPDSFDSSPLNAIFGSFRPSA